MITKMTQCNVVCETEKGRYCDALYYPEDKVPDDKVIEAEIQKRADAWVELIKNPPVPPELTKEELEQQKIDIQNQIDSLTAQVDELTTKIASKVIPIVEK